MRILFHFLYFTLLSFGECLVFSGGRSGCSGGLGGLEYRGESATLYFYKTLMFKYQAEQCPCGH